MTLRKVSMVRGENRAPDSAGLRHRPQLPRQLRLSQIQKCSFRRTTTSNRPQCWNRLAECERKACGTDQTRVPFESHTIPSRSSGTRCLFGRMLRRQGVRSPSGRFQSHIIRSRDQ